ncbi:TetR family transcriptional regulator [Pseudoduganella lurida]|uniref:TetR family transcriptional regulator n=1 Tax=Pseudoduganella lurida TaxID=1036180 RepID=A0A562R7X9_9BURK|nr:TetR/AcrR family transcriptional regulator [Pseudoduganella lurida]TWI64476.1 TetR family transcriptional regulator [Pseudoduganella lurida]
MARAGRPKACESEARTQELMTTAFQLFLEKGYSKVSLEMIARKAHVAVRTIYVKFGGKSGLFREILKTGRDAAFQSMEDLATTQAPMREVLLDFGLRMHELISSGPVIQLHRMVIAEAHHDRELAEAFFEGGPQRTRAALQRYFSRPDVRAQLRDLPADVLAIHLMNCLMGDQLKRYLFMLPCADGIDPALLGQRVDLFLGGAKLGPASS